MPLMLTLLTLAHHAAAVSNPWAADFAAQRPSARPRLDCRYTDASRRQAEIIGQDFRLVLHLGDEEKHQAVVFGGGEGGREVARLSIEAPSGKTYSSLRGTEKSRINLYRRGPYYLEVHWFDVMCADEAGAPFPAKGEVVFCCYPEKVHVQTIWHAVEGAERLKPGVVRIVVSDGRSAEASFEALKAGDKLSAAMPLLGVPTPGSCIQTSICPASAQWRHEPDKLHSTTPKTTRPWHASRHHRRLWCGRGIPQAAGGGERRQDVA